MKAKKDLPFNLAYLRRSDLPQARPKKTAALIAQRIVRQITTMRLQPGDQLPSERDMLADYLVGRSTLREALRFLEMQGILVIRPGPRGGPVVSIPEPRYLAGNISMVLEFARTPFRAVIETRAVIEPVVAASAAKRINKQQLSEIADSIEVMANNTVDLATFMGENLRFHDLIAWASGNTVFGLLLSSVQSISFGTALGVQYPTWARKVIVKAHRRIHSALADGNAEAAGQAMAAHNREYIRYLEEKYPELLDQIVQWEPG
jgi:GntR family transcriptional regulator, transcriptional repressor for pyruvate dehydrogenase complex